MKINLSNATGSAFVSDQIFFAVIGKVGAKFHHIQADGTSRQCLDADNTGPGSLVKNGTSFSNYFFNLGSLTSLDVPEMVSARLYISVGETMYLQVHDNGDGVTGPDPQNPSDPNLDVRYDWVEFTTDAGGFHGNTTQVDQFCIPITIELVTADGTQKQTGLTRSRKQIFGDYAASVPTAFQALALSDLRIVAPHHGSLGKSGFWDSYVDEMWTRSLSLTIDEGSFTGTLVGGVLTFTGTDGQQYTIARKPTTLEVFACSDVLADADASKSGAHQAVEKAIKAQVAALINRHMMEWPEDRCKSSSYYSAAPSNSYAQFWHTQSDDGKAYGFPFDDVCNQSTLIEGGAGDLANTSLNVTIRWD